MKCGKCNFSVPNNMRFCLMRNMCPSCGAALFSDEDANHLAMMQNRIKGQSFSKEFDDVQVFDLALFIYNEIKSGYGKVLLDEEVKKVTKKSRPDKEADVPYNHEGEEDDADDINEEDVAVEVKKEVEAEIRQQLMKHMKEDLETTYEEEADFDEDDRVSRLKAQARKHNKDLQGASVRRVG
jgi:hypothetical protein